MAEQLTVGNESIQIIPYEGTTGIENRVEYEKIPLTPTQQARINALAQQIPTLSAAESLANAYILRLPADLQGVHLMELAGGGNTATLVSDTTGKIAGTGSLYSLTSQAAILGAFSAMSIASGQYFLAQINSELGKINQGIDKILEFLYGDKKAELISEVSFAKFAYQNYSSIMDHEQQRTATIISLQEARKVAMKDVEFYLNDLDSSVNAKDSSDILTMVDRAFQIKECLELAMQLYVMSNLLEIYFAQNHDPQYLRFVESDMTMYIGKCEKRILGNFNRLKVHVTNAKIGPLKKIDKAPLEKRVDEVLEILNRGEESEVQKTLRMVINASAKGPEFCLCTDGRVYFKTK